jgi:AraC family transcriptional regulator
MLRTIGGEAVDELTEKAMARVVELMRENLSEQLTVDDLARAAMFSKFHFSRIFRRATGVSPGRFLSAMRLQEAKRLLVTTSLSVTDISHRVGYASVGTFSTRFRSSVGISPSTYRRLGGFTTRMCVDTRRRHLTGRCPASVRGRVLPPARDRATGSIFLGLFPDVLPEGQPVRCTVLHQAGPFTLGDIPLGTWHLLCFSVTNDDASSLVPRQRQREDDGVFVGSYGPITIRPETGERLAEIKLRPMSPLDPPVLPALLDARTLRSQAQAPQSVVRV